MAHSSSRMGHAVLDALRLVYARRWSQFAAQRADTAFPRSAWKRGEVA